MAAEAGGAALLFLAAVDSLVSWPSNRVMLSHDDLSGIAGASLIPLWFWLAAAAAVLGAVRWGTPT
ncbi:hypothetical protein E6W39_12015 [Kitasatospora acidiphila]|uniref:Uncharacterized protein n=1 Tax=Kitasatospora acidiphila TaxID=2567942 RepID=A0A540W1I0_9ACTN|nr:hypothetical protein [Kitasatospora acidiphila]TQF02852.1 hypothetical protein E6W39_12015 [Kitasatospora acidiphila]